MFTQGAYSYHDMSVTDADVEAVSEPINGTLFFAGEHTDPLYYGSLHAAYNSGVRVINNLEKIEL